MEVKNNGKSNNFSRPSSGQAYFGRKTTTLVLAIPRSFRNDNGEYETDFIPVSLVGQTACSVNEYCKQGDLIGVRGRMAKLPNSDMQIIGEKVSFLANGRKVED